MSNLYNINKEMFDLLNNFIELEEYIINHETGEVHNQEDYLNILSKIKIKREDKIHNILLYIESIKADIEALTKRIKSIQNKKNIRLNQIDKLHNYLMENMSQGEKIDFDDISIKIHQGLESINIQDEEKIPKEYCTIKKIPNKLILKKALKSGVNIDGVSIIKKDKRLVVK